MKKGGETRGPDDDHETCRKGRDLKRNCSYPRSSANNDGRSIWRGAERAPSGGTTRSRDLHVGKHGPMVGEVDAVVEAVWQDAEADNVEALSLVGEEEINAPGRLTCFSERSVGDVVVAVSSFGRHQVREVGHARAGRRDDSVGSSVWRAVEVATEEERDAVSGCSLPVGDELEQQFAALLPRLLSNMVQVGAHDDGPRPRRL